MTPDIFSFIHLGELDLFRKIQYMKLTWTGKASPEHSSCLLESKSIHNWDSYSDSYNKSLSNEASGRTCKKYNVLVWSNRHLNAAIYYNSHLSTRGGLWKLEIRLVTLVQEKREFYAKLTTQLCFKKKTTSNWSLTFDIITLPLTTVTSRWNSFSMITFMEEKEVWWRQGTHGANIRGLKGSLPQILPLAVL